MLEVDKVKPPQCVQTTICSLNGPLCEYCIVRGQPSCALSRQFLSDRFNGCLAVGHAWTRGAVSCQEPDGYTLGLLISQTGSPVALRQVEGGGGGGTEGGTGRKGVKSRGGHGRGPGRIWGTERQMWRMGVREEESKRRATFWRDRRAEGEMWWEGEERQDLSRTKWVMKGEI